MNTMPRISEPQYVKSKKGFDFNLKPISKDTKTDQVFAWWNNRPFFMGEMKADSCDLYTEKEGKAVFAFTVKYKNITLIKKKEDELQQS